MPSAVPARKVAGNKTGPVRRKRAARQVEPKYSRDYSEALRMKCRKDALWRKPANVSVCPECNEKGTVITQHGYHHKWAGKWIQTCVNKVTNVMGQRVKCTHFKIPDQPPVPKKQLAAIERQRTADIAVRVAADAEREAAKARSEADAEPGDAELELRVVEAETAAAEAVEEVRAACAAVAWDDEHGWDETPPPSQPSSSRVTLDHLIPSSATSSRTSTSQAQLEVDHAVAANLQSRWDAQTNTSPESAYNGAARNGGQHGQDASEGRRHLGPTRLATKPADTSNRIRQAARLQQQAADWLGQTDVSSPVKAQARGTSSSSPLDTPTPAARARNLRPFPLEIAPLKSVSADKDGARPTKTTSANVPQGVKSMTTPVKKKAVRSTDDKHAGYERTPPSTQPRRTNSTNVPRHRSVSVPESPPPSTQPPRSTEILKKRRRSPLVTASVISISSDDAPPPAKRQCKNTITQVKQEVVEDGMGVAGGTKEVSTSHSRDTPRVSRPKPRPQRKSASCLDPTPRSPEIGSASIIAPARLPIVTLSPRTTQHVVRRPSATRPRQPATRESTLESSNKENHAAERRASVHGPPPECPPSRPSSPRVDHAFEEDDVLPELAPIDDSDDDEAPLARAHRIFSAHHTPSGKCPTPRVHPTYHLSPRHPAGRPPLSLPFENSSYDRTCRARCGVLVEQNDTSKAPWDSSEDDEAGGELPAEDGHASGGDGDIEEMSDEEHVGELRQTDALESAADQDYAPGEEHGGSLYETASSDEPDSVDNLTDDRPSTLVEKSVQAAADKPWTHDFDDVDAWYCTVFIWTVNRGRPRQVLLSMNVGETEVRLSDRPPIYTALGGLRVDTFLVWDFSSTNWIARAFTTVFTVSEFDQHTLLIRLPDVVRCLEFGKAMAYAQEPLWPALDDDGEPNDANAQFNENKANREREAEGEADNEEGDVQAYDNDNTYDIDGEDNAQVDSPASTAKPSRKGKEVVRT